MTPSSSTRLRLCSDCSRCKHSVFCLPLSGMSICTAEFEREGCLLCYGCAATHGDDVKLGEGCAGVIDTCPCLPDDRCLHRLGMAFVRSMRSGKTKLART